METQTDQYQTVNTFTRTPQLTQVISYILVTAIFVVFFAAVQGNYQDQGIRITMIILFTIDFCVLAISTFLASKTDPVDPVMVQYRNGNRA